MKNLTSIALLAILATSVSQAQTLPMARNYSSLTEIDKIILVKLKKDIQANFEELDTSGGSNSGGKHSGGSNSGGKHSGGSNSGGRSSGGSNSGGADEPIKLEVIRTHTLAEFVKQAIPMIRIQGAASPELAIEQYENLLTNVNGSITTNQQNSWLYRHTQAALLLNESLTDLNVRNDIRLELLDHSLVTVQEVSSKVDTGYFAGRASKKHSSKIPESVKAMVATELAFIQKTLFINQSNVLVYAPQIQYEILEKLGAELAWAVLESPTHAQQLLNLKNIKSATELKNEIAAIINTL